MNSGFQEINFPIRGQSTNSLTRNISKKLHHRGHFPAQEGPREASLMKVLRSNAR